ncbi:hypothetical protein AMECASPLE_030555 [Ameca splendens]|uniref:Ig-like domain-containing protein n=1 Tax=Ameca splendens TaxID=208324 RepID=A0ABV0YTU6_9TELE
MLLFWVTLLVLLCQGNTFVPVVTVQLGEPVTLTCLFTETTQSISWLHWYRQTAGDTLKLISMVRHNTNPTYGPGFSSPSFHTTLDNKISNLSILKTTTEDEGMYHCANINWLESTWSGTYLLLKGNTETTSSYHVVQQAAVLDPSHPADSETLQCSLFSEPEGKNCSGDPNVFWFRTTSDKSFPELIYTDGKIPENCEKTSSAQKKCSYNFYKNVASSDVGTYYCAVATCGQILLGNGTKVEIANSSRSAELLVVTTVICLAISVIVNIVLICCGTQRTSRINFTETSSSQVQYTSQPDGITEDGEHLTYAALHFSTGTTNKRGLKIEESIYSNARESISMQ